MVETGDRRPIASRNLPIWQRTAVVVARAGVSANAISVVGMMVGVLAGAALMATSSVQEPLLVRGLFLVGAAGIQLRLLANMLDGMVAVASGKASLMG